MDDILSQIIAYAPDKIDTELKAAALVQGSRNMDQEPRNMYNQGSSVDHAVRTIDPVQDSGNKIEEVLKAYGRYRGSRKGKRPMKFKNFFELYATENFATGGSAGQLVQNTNDGSRPGYAGDDVTGEIPEIYDDELLKKRISIGRTGPTSQAVTVGEIFEKVKNVQGGPESISDFKKNPTESKFISLRKKYKNRVKTERVQNLSTKEKAKFRQKVITSEKKWRASEKGQAYYNKLNATKGIFPANTPQERVWRDIYRASKQSKENSRFKIKYPKNIEIDPETNLPKKIKAKSGSSYIPWDRYYKNISFYDTETGSTIKFGNMREWMKNNVKGGGKKYDNAIGNYKIRQSISDFDIGGQSLGDTFKQSKSAVGASPTTVKLASPSAVNHISGLDNFWDTEITTSTGNKQLNDKVQSKISAYQNSANPMKKEKILKQMKAEINKIQGGATLVVDGETIGKKPTLRKVSNALSKELDVDLLKLASTVTDQCRIGNAIGGRIGFKTAGSVDCLSIGKKTAKDLMEKGLKNGFPKNQQGDLARKILGSGKFLKEAVSLRGLFGPAALAFTVLTEAGFVGYDMLSEGKSFREAVGDSLFNYMLGDKTKIDSDKEFIKRLKNIPGSPSQGFRGVTDEDIGKMQYFNSIMGDIQTGSKNYNTILDLEEKIRDNTLNKQVPEFSDQAFQLNTQLNKAQAENQDYFRLNKPGEIEKYTTTKEDGTMPFVQGAEAALKASLLADEDRYKDINPSSLKGLEALKKKKIDNAYDLYRMNNPTKITGYEDATPSEMSYVMSKIKNEPDNNYGLFGPAELMEGGIASLNVKK